MNLSVAEAITEVILVGIPGPTHHYGGLSADNVASSTNRGSQSAPREAALQALELVKLLRSLGIVAGVLPPQLRPYLPLLCERFSGSDEEVIAQAGREAPELLEKASSSSSMWTANAATITSGIDDAGILHITPANLQTNLHRRIEAGATHCVLAAMFERVPNAKVHAPLSAQLRDEGAANHMRLSPTHNDKGLHVFAYAEGEGRQTLAASQAVAARHEIQHALFIAQNPKAIAAGVFHNDVIAVSNENLLLAHELAFANGRSDIQLIADAYAKLHPGKNLCSIIIPEAELSLKETVDTYFFNSQIVSTKDGMAIIAPMEAKELYNGKAAKLFEQIVADKSNPVSAVHYIDLRQSMRNGGGPACLRLRIPMTNAQLAALQKNTNVISGDAQLTALSRLIERTYPESLTARELAEPKHYHNCRALLQEMSLLLGLPLL